jgi:PIN domain nuclease of toxin-antitoxin system
VLADTNLFIKFCRRLPLPAAVESTLADSATERCLSPVSVIELFRLWQSGKVPDDPDTWLDVALPSWTVLPVTVPIARQSVLWPWEHKDPADRLLAAPPPNARRLNCGTPTPSSRSAPASRTGILPGLNHRVWTQESGVALRLPPHSVALARGIR